MIFGVAETVAFLSQNHDPGARRHHRHGHAGGRRQLRAPPLFLHPGDIVKVEIEGIGTLRKPCRRARLTP